MINVVALAPAALTVIVLALARWAPRGSTPRARRQSARSLALWVAVTAVCGDAFLIGQYLQSPDLAVWAAFGLIAAAFAAVTASAAWAVSSIVRDRASP